MYKVILVPLDGSKRAERILPYVEVLSRKSGGKVLLLQIIGPTYSMIGEDIVGTSLYSRNADDTFDRAKKYLETKKKQLEEQNLEIEILVEHGPIVETIMNVANEKSVDIIAIASHGRGGIGRIFYGSVAAGVLHRVDRPILVIRSRQDD